MLDARGVVCLDLQQPAGQRIESLERIPLSFFTDNAGKVIVRPNHPLFKGIPPYNAQWQPHYTFLSDQFAKHCRCNEGESLSKTHFIRHQCSWHISIPNPPPHDEPDGPNLVLQKLCSGQAWNWILVAWNPVICWLTSRMSIQQPDCLIKTLVFQFVVDCTENCIQHWARICWIEGLLTILHLLLNLRCICVHILSVLSDLFQLLRCKLGRWADIPALLKLIVMLGISQTSNYWNEYIRMQYNQFYFFNQNLHQYKYYSLAHHPPLPPLFHPLQNLPMSMYND